MSSKSKNEFTLDNFMLAENMYGKFYVPRSSSHTYTSKTILRGDVHEPKTIKFICQHSYKGDVIHAGAGFGDFLPGLSRGCNGKIWTFEPNLENYRSAKKTIRANQLKNIKLFNYALGKSQSEGLLRIAKNNLTLGPRCEMFFNQDDVLENEIQSTKIVTLDAIIPKKTAISIIHLDVEGYEFEVLLGAQDTIQRNNPLIILEIHTEALKYNEFMETLDYFPFKQLIYNAGPMVFVNTVYKQRGLR